MHFVHSHEQSKNLAVIGVLPVCSLPGNTIPAVVGLWLRHRPQRGFTILSLFLYSLPFFEVIVSIVPYQQYRVSVSAVIPARL